MRRRGLLALSLALFVLVAAPLRPAMAEESPLDAEEPVRLSVDSLDMTGTVCEPIEPLSFSATGGTRPYDWMHMWLPSGLAYQHVHTDDTAVTQRIAGTPQVAGTFAAVVQVTSDDGTTDHAVGDIVLAPGPVRTDTDQDADGVAGLLITAREGTPLKPVALHATCGDGASYSWRALDPLPRGLRLENGTISGTLPTPGVHRFTVEAESAGYTDTMDVTVAVRRARLHFVPPDYLPYAADQHFYNQRVRADGGWPGYRWRVVAGSLPPGIRLGERGRQWQQLRGVAQRPGRWEFKLRVTDRHGNVRAKWYAIRVQPWA